MSDQVHKTLLACDELNRTGQEAPASRETRRKNIKVLAHEIASDKNPDELFRIFAALVKISSGNRQEMLEEIKVDI